MQNIQPEQHRRMRAIANTLGMDNDALHVLVEGVTGCASIKALDKQQADAVIVELAARQRAAGIKPPPSRKKHEVTPGYITIAQQKKVWALMYELERLSPSKGGATVGERLCGIIGKTFGMKMRPKTPFVWVTAAQGRKLIDTIKNYVEQAQREADKEGRVEHG